MGPRLVDAAQPKEREANPRVGESALGFFNQAPSARTFNHDPALERPPCPRVLRHPPVEQPLCGYGECHVVGHLLLLSREAWWGDEVG